MEQINSKILLFGEYAILHQGMALVMPCEKYSGHFEFYNDTDDKKAALQSNEYLKRFSEFIKERSNEKFVLEVQQFEKELEQGLFFRSNIPQGYGLGSSGAVVAAMVLRYLKKAKNIKDELKYRIHELKGNLGELESHFHGVSSGLDPLSIILNEPILYKNAQEILPTKLPTKSEINENVVFLLDTKIPRHAANLIGHFNTLYQTTSFKDKFDNYVVEANNKTIEHFLHSNFSFYESLANLSAFQLNEMKDFIPENLHALLAKGLDNGDYFLKLCGAGGGGFMLGFTKEWEKTQAQLKDFHIEEIYRY